MASTRIYHQNKFGTNVTSNQTSGVTTTPLNSIPSITAPFYIALDATNINGSYEVVQVTSKTATHINHAATTYAHTTAEEVRMVIPATEMDDISSNLYTLSTTGTSGADGWTTVADTWTYASATTITVPAGAATLYKKGDKVSVVANSVTLYAYIVTVADTLLTVAGNALTNHTFTVPRYSHQDSPIGFPDFFTFVGAATGFAATPTETHWFSLNGTVCTVESVVTGTSNATSKTMTLPITPEALERRFAAFTVDNGTSTIGRAEIGSSGATATFHRDAAGNTWTNSGSAAFHLRASYIIN